MEQKPKRSGDWPERIEVEEVQRIADNMKKSRDGQSVGRKHQRAKEIADTIDWVKEMNRSAEQIDENSVQSVDKGER